MDPIDVFLSKHAQLDCLPLRFGVLFNTQNAKFYGVYDDQATQNQKPKEIRNGNKHYCGRLCHSSGVEIDDVRVVLAKPDINRVAQAVISVMYPKVGLAERAVTDLIRSLRENNEITSQQIIDELHTPYKDGLISTTLEMYKSLVSKGIRDGMAGYDEEIADVSSKAELLMSNAKFSQDENAKLKRKVIDLELQVAGYRGDTVETAPICTLKTVSSGTRTNKSGKVFDCTYFDFEEDVPVRVMDKWCDPTGEIVDRAKFLIGKPVITTTWKPEIYPPLMWCRNIYEA